MVEVSCLACRDRMTIDENEPHTEWECPTCAAVFRVQPHEDGTLDIVVIESAPVQTTAIQPESSGQSPLRPRRNRATLDTGHDDDANLDVALPAGIPFQDRFPDLQPGQPPGLFTMNGVGFMMYGHRDFDLPTRTYVKSACFTIFFVPIFIIGSYRVADAPAEGWFSTGSWHILGKVPLSPLAKGWNWAMLGVLSLFSLMCLFRM